MKQLIEFISQGSLVTRYHTVDTLTLETVGHHSHGVAMLVLVLDPQARREVLIAALLHDLAECITGDIPSPAKRLYGITAQVDDLEETIMRNSGWVLPVLEPAERRVLKLADIAQGALFCVRELNKGNRTMRLVYDRYMSYAQKMDLVGSERQLFNAIKEQLQ